ncbi:ribonuclease Z [Methanobrevibacter sp. OttesenSCG-928-K11]|nr:ribonuclease Z [Methanobrevibacter sp. OttesenSCG-928-K11]MDL2270586.1 ribonuclease Z [Methanobrevibacter sp. OttesenSCG-928-I08]
MELTFLGTSSAVPSTKRNHPAIALKAFGEIMLLDCGEGTQRQLAFARISPMKINKIFLSHFHGDHILGLPGLIQSMGFRGRKEPLHIYGPKGLNALKNPILNLGYCLIEFPIEFHEISDGIVVENEEYLISCAKTKHNVTNLSYSVEEKKKPRFLREKAIELGVQVGPDFSKLHNGEEVEVEGKIIKPSDVLGDKRKGKKITYSGDTMPSEAMIKLAENSNLLIHEATYIFEDSDKARENTHSTSTDAGEIAKRANVEKLIITHISTRYTDDGKLLEQTKKIFKNSEIATDLMTIEI